ncbi:hypothetical protein RLOC_00011023 [Lonchura striata]|uniref:Uncharacterized protein n=1 Tax=Lonchura striata TaxID=40157 RepID=A0A218VDD2_9PASE|nr:hypothetical protein RLOC_00011023 [Lonchura striata domestica]
MVCIINRSSSVGSQLLTHPMMCLSSCVLDILSRRILLETVLKAVLKSKRIRSAGFP